MSEVPRGQRLVPKVIDDYSCNQPDRVFASVPADDDDLSKGYRDFTYRQIANAIDYASFWLDKTLGRSDGSFETFVYIGTRDLRYSILAAAAAKTGRVALFLSLFGSMESHVFLANKTNTKHILYADELESLAKGINANYSRAPCISVPAQSEWLNDNVDSVPHYPYTKTFAEAEWDPVFIVHTSGTTGLPKPVAYTNGHLSTVDRYFDLPALDGRSIYLARVRGFRIYNSLPVFHIVGVLFTLATVVFGDSITVLGPANKAPSLEIAEGVLDYSGTTIAILAPFLLEVLGREPRTMAKLKKLKATLFGGALLCNPVGDELAQAPGVEMMNVFGSTEGGGWLTLSVDQEDWQWITVHPYMGFQMENQGDDEHFEAVVYRTPESEKYSNFWRTFPNDKVFHTKDLFSPHPTKKGLWRYRCRLDDLVLLTGEIKLYARTIEEAVGDHPTVSGVLVGGDRRSHPFMLLELTEDNTRSAEQILNDVWETVEKQNKRNAPSARIRRDMTILLSGQKVLVRSPKGSIERRKTFAKYESEIDGLYGGPVGNEDIKRHDSADGTIGSFVPGTENINRSS